MDRGYVKLWRKTLDSGIISNGPAWQLFGYLLMNACHTERKVVVRGAVFDLKAGDVVFSRSMAAAKLELGEQQIRTALNLLKKLEIVTSKSTNKITIISFVKWNTYNSQQPADNQQDNQPPNQHLTSTQPANEAASIYDLRIKELNNNINTKSIKACAEPKPASAPPAAPAEAKEQIPARKNTEPTPQPKEKRADPCVLELPVTGTPESPMHKIHASDVEHWQGLYPGVDVMQQLRAMQGWLEANPTRKKTKKGIRRFVVNWLGREQNRGGAPARASPNSKTWQEMEEERFQAQRKAAMLRDMARETGADSARAGIQ